MNPTPLPPPPASRRRLLLYIAAVLVPLAGSSLATLVRSVVKGARGGLDPLPVFTPARWLEGSFQKDCEDWYGENFVGRTFLVRTSNQLSYTLFDEVPFKGRAKLVLGKNRNLFAYQYIHAYYGRDALPPVVLEAFAKDLRRFQDYLRGRGVAFLFMLTPSKASIYPEDIPDHLGEPSGRPAPSDYEILLPLLAKHGVETFDGRAAALTLKKTSGHRLFATTGFHWNPFCALKITQDLLPRLEQILGRPLHRLALDRVDLQLKPRSGDADLTNLACLWRPAAFYTPNPYPTASRIPTAGAETPDILLVGDSFLELTRHWLQDTGICSPDSEHRLYYRNHPADPVADLLRRDLILLGMNEGLLAWRGYGMLEQVLGGTYRSPFP